MQLKQNTVKSNRIIYTPSVFAKSSLLYLQEVGNLKALLPHKSSRENLSSYLIFTVVSGEGVLNYGGEIYELSVGDAVFIDCHIPYSHATSDDLWSLSWVHFNGSTMDEIYEKYVKRGGKPVFHPMNEYKDVLSDIFLEAQSDSYVRDMKLNVLLSNLLVLLMEDAWDSEESLETGKYNQLSEIKVYLDEHYARNLTLDTLSKIFFVNKTYLSEIFKEKYGIGISEYLIRKRITKTKELLRFSDKSIEEISREVGINGGAYLSRIFKKIEMVTPLEYRKIWR